MYVCEKLALRLAPVLILSIIQIKEERVDMQFILGCISNCYDV